MYIIIQCRFCGNILIADGGYRTKLCTYCGKRLKLSGVKILAKATSSHEALEIAKAIKEKLSAFS